MSQITGCFANVIFIYQPIKPFFHVVLRLNLSMGQVVSPHKLYFTDNLTHNDSKSKKWLFIIVMRQYFKVLASCVEVHSLYCLWVFFFSFSVLIAPFYRKWAKITKGKQNSRKMLSSQISALFDIFLEAV